MGTDVHGIWQAKKNGVWTDIPSTWEQNRHYFLFAWLAGVRNGFGFAGVKTHSPLKPIAEPRGLPADFEHEDREHKTTVDCIDPRRQRWMSDEDKASPAQWLGDHSHSWLMADEILAAPLPGSAWKTGVVERAFFDSWDGHTPPTDYCGGISGGAVRVAESPVDVKDDSTHVQIYWKAQESDELQYFVDEVRRLKELHGEVRLVFGFDS